MTATGEAAMLIAGAPTHLPKKSKSKSKCPKALVGLNGARANYSAAARERIG